MFSLASDCTPLCGRGAPAHMSRACYKQTLLTFGLVEKSGTYVPSYLTHFSGWMGQRIGFLVLMLQLQQ